MAELLTYLLTYISSTIGCANFGPDWPLLFKVHEIGRGMEGGEGEEGKGREGGKERGKGALDRLPPRFDNPSYGPGCYPFSALKLLVGLQE